jgi:hypothetical protein
MTSKGSSKVVVLVIAATILTATIAVSLAIPAYAEPNNPTADENVHENTPGEFAGDQDVRYHEGTCQGGSDHPVCDDEDIISDPGNSDENRNDD